MQDVDYFRFYIGDRLSYRFPVIEGDISSAMLLEASFSL